MSVLPGMLVLLQLTALAWLSWTAASAVAAHAPSWPSWTLFALAVGLGAWALTANRPGNFNIRPTPKAGGHLATAGPYRWIRHPMYSAIMAFAIAAALQARTVDAWLVFLALAAVLVVKSLLEEHWMGASHPAYSAYARRKTRFIPFLC